MSSESWLTPDEVQQLTERQKWSAQCRALASMGIPFRPNAVGRPLVERALVFSAERAGSPRKKTQPNWENIGGKAA
ncbi:DUF4224 domain-containing protein [Pseudoxanthomonas sp.]|uniref:DUF4224 domain-containing protein n=1 Tax=Pseudoxanthomonas sp. TaxID=1871049 RepID=UPI003F823088